jgi:hypothetical protein
MSVRERVRQEVVEIALATLFFAAFLCVLVVLKILLLDEYHIRTRGLVAALIGAVILAKVVLVLEHVPLGAWVRRKPPVYDLVLRTALYGLGVLVVLLIEKAFEARHEYGGFGRATMQVYRHRDMPHVWVNTVVVLMALLLFNVFAVVRRLVGRPRLLPLFFSQAPPEPQTPRQPAPEARAAVLHAD